MQACADLRVVALAGAELEIVEPDQPGLGAERGACFQGVIEQMIGAGEARIGPVHRRRRDAGEPQRAAARARLLRGKRMRLVRRLGALGGGCEVDQHAAVLDLDGISRERGPPRSPARRRRCSGGISSCARGRRCSRRRAGPRRAGRRRGCRHSRPRRIAPSLNEIARSRFIAVDALERRLRKLIRGADVDPVFISSHDRLRITLPSSA